MKPHLVDLFDYRTSASVLYGPAMPIDIDVTDGTVVVRPRGELDVATAPRLDRQLAEVLDAEPSDVILDLSQLSFMDSTGVRVLMAARQRADAQSCGFILRSPRRSVLRVLELTGVARLMVIEPAGSAT